MPVIFVFDWPSITPAAAAVGAGATAALLTVCTVAA